MTYDRGHLSVYFKEEEVLRDLQTLIEKDLKGQVSVSSLICEIMKHIVPQLRDAAKEGKRTGIKVTATLDLT